MGTTVERPVLARRLVLVVGYAVVVAAGARGAYVLSGYMMNAVALVGAWMMLTLLGAALVTRFRPSVGGPLLVGFGAGAVVVALFAGMAMMT